MATLDGKQSIGGDGVGDWLCSDPDCKNLNFARRTQCNRCQREREETVVLALAADDGVDGGSCSESGGISKKKLGTEIGKAAAEKSRGLFSAEDWQCSKCANVNWARRQTCNMCNAPKFCAVEERTGYGGGYNDRGIVEYKEREDSDDEYDEFGRRKKRRDEMKSKVAPAPAKKENQPVEEDDEEEEDEEDGGDLSKYDLWGSDEDTKNVKPHSRSKSHSSRSRSSSSSSSSSSSTSSSLSRKRSGSKSRSHTSSKHSRDRSRSTSRRNSNEKYNNRSVRSRSNSRTRSTSRRSTYSKSPTSNSSSRYRHRSRSRSPRAAKRRY